MGSGEAFLLSVRLAKKNETNDFLPNERFKDLRIFKRQTVIESLNRTVNTTD